MDKEGVGGLTVTEAELETEPSDLFVLQSPHDEYLDGFTQEYLTNLSGNTQGPYEFESMCTREY